MAKQPTPGKPSGSASTTQAPKPGAKGKEPDKKAEFVKVTTEVARKGARKIFYYLTWVVIIVGLCWGFYMLFLKPDERVRERGTPDSVIETYTTFVSPYVPPASLSPTQDTVNQWLRYFDGHSRKWFEDNIDKLSYLSVRRDSATWTEMTAGKRKMEAMQFMLTRGPMRGGAVVRQEHDPSSDVAVVTITTGSSTHQVNLRRVGNTWEMQSFMDMIPVVNPQLANVVPPGSK